MSRSRISIIVPVSSSNVARAHSFYHTSEENKVKKVVDLNKNNRTHTVKSLTI